MHNRVHQKSTKERTLYKVYGIHKIASCVGRESNLIAIIWIWFEALRVKRPYWKTNKFGITDLEWQ